MFNAASESVAIAIASALGSRYYDTDVVYDDTEAVVCTHYDVTDAERSWQNGCRTRFIRVNNGVVTDVDDYFESSEQEKVFGRMTDAYARLLRPSIDNAEKCAEEVIVEGCPLDDDDIPF